jgi:hypothetical protein
LNYGVYIKERLNSDCRANYINIQQLGKIIKLITVKSQYNGTSFTCPTTLWTGTTTFTPSKFTVKNSCEQKVDIVNPPDIIYMGGYQTHVPLRTCNYGFGAVKLVFERIGFVQQGVPSSRTCKLLEHEICKELWWVEYLLIVTFL